MLQGFARDICRQRSLLNIGIDVAQAPHTIIFAYSTYDCARLAVCMAISHHLALPIASQSVVCPPWARAMGACGTCAIVISASEICGPLAEEQKSSRARSLAPPLSCARSVPQMPSPTASRRQAMMARPWLTSLTRARASPLPAPMAACLRRAIRFS